MKIFCYPATYWPGDRSIPLAAWVDHGPTEDGAGHEAPHYNLMQSWIPIQPHPDDVIIETEEEKLDSHDAAERAKALAARKNIRGAETTRQDFEKKWASVRAFSERLAGVKPCPLSPARTTLTIA